MSNSQFAPLGLATDPEGWEIAWQEDLDAAFPLVPRTFDSAEFDEAIRESGDIVEEEIFSYMAQHKSLVTTEGNLRALSVHASVMKNFEQAWRDAGPATRKRHYFDAMGQIFHSEPLEKPRGYAPDMSLRSFERNNGEGFLDILRALVDEKPPGCYAYIPHASFEANMELALPWDSSACRPRDKKHLVQMQMTIARIQLLSNACLLVLQSFAYGKMARIVNASAEVKGRHAKRASPGHVLRESKRAENHLYEEWCSGCHKFTSEFAGGSPMKVCKACKTIGRMVWYCSRECQTQDWKRGDPPHKSICGTPTLELPLPLPALQEPEDETIPPAAEGFIRSLALQHHIKLLRADPECDHVLLVPPPEPRRVELYLTRGAEREAFGLIRNRAFRYGDAPSVQALYDFLAKIVAEMRTPSGDDMTTGIRRQIKREFGIDVTA